MLASELLKATVVDADGENLGTVRDVRLVREGDGYRATGILVGAGAMSAIGHAWGYAEGRASGPWLLQTLLRRGVRSTTFVRADDVASWDDAGRVTLRAGAAVVAAEAALA